MKMIRHWLVLTACNLALLALTAMVNDGLAGWSVAIALSGLCVVGPALRLGLPGMLGCLAVTGLAADAGRPTPPGFLMSLMVAGAILVHLVRPLLGRIRRPQQVGMAWVLNAGFLIAFTLWALARNHAGGPAFWARVVVDFCLSQLILIPVSLWFFDFQESVLVFAGLTAVPPQPGVAG